MCEQMKWKSFLLVAAMVLIIPCCAMAQTNFLVYMMGGDLERDSGAASDNIREMLRAQPGEEVNITLLTGGSPVWHTAIPKNDGACILHLRQGKIVPVDHWPEVSLGSSETLARFLKIYAPVQDTNYLVFWGHGMKAMGGIGPDLNAGGDCLSLFEIVSALEERDAPFAMIGFDACRMATLENAWMLAPYCDYFVASPWKEPLSGWAYRAWLSNGERDVPECLEDLQVHTRQRWMRNASDAALEIVQSSKLLALESALNRLFAETALHEQGASLARIAGDDPAFSRWMENDPALSVLCTDLYSGGIPPEVEQIPGIGPAYSQWLRRCPLP